MLRPRHHADRVPLALPLQFMREFREARLSFLVG